MALFSRHPVDDDACFIIIDVSRYVNNEQVKKSPSKEMFTRKGSTDRCNKHVQPNSRQYMVGCRWQRKLRPAVGYIINCQLRSISFNRVTISVFRSYRLVLQPLVGERRDQIFSLLLLPIPLSHVSPRAFLPHVTCSHSTHYNISSTVVHYVLRSPASKMNASRFLHNDTSVNRMIYR